MHKCILIPICILLLCYVTGCAANSAAAKLDEEKRIGIILTDAGLGDQEWNDVAVEGLTKARDRLDIVYTYKEITPELSYERALEELAEEGMDTIITIESEAKDAVSKQAKANPGITYIAFETDLKGDNLYGYQFDAEQAGYLAGVAAATVTKTNKAGFIGDRSSAYLKGFQQGVEDTSKETELLVREASADDEAAGKRLARELIDEEVDILFAGPGDAGKAMIEQAALADRYVIGAGGDQAYLAPDHVVTSAMLQIDHVLFEFLERLSKGKQLPEGDVIGLGEQAVGLSPIAVVSITDTVEGKVHTATQKLIESE
ncbi:BMP family ABC transporter substrate-binding protein [Terribacillus sp. 179-K 1B1 HS]|uniref:BMP family ABC transporter substrate-binding protein n=1 Tax=Terribacillus sp. 179-K 1B1 HS TaxID=3142388 RepID=UPI0039A227CD